MINITDAIKATHRAGGISLTLPQALRSPPPAPSATTSLAPLTKIINGNHVKLPTPTPPTATSKTAAPGKTSLAVLRLKPPRPLAKVAGRLHRESIRT
jgi:hypothetical protein